MSFKVGGDACVGFDQAGPLFEYGYAWRIIGYGRVTKVENPEAFVKAVLGAYGSVHRAPTGMRWVDPSSPSSYRRATP